MATPYFYWKIRAAVETLAGSDAPVRQRIEWALQNLLGLVERELPPEVLPLWLELEAQTTWKVDGTSGEGLWRDTLAAMSDEDARKVTALMVKLLVITSRRVDLEDVIQD